MGVGCEDVGLGCEGLGYDVGVGCGGRMWGHNVRIWGMLFVAPSEGLRLMLWHTAQRVSYRVSGVQGRDRQGASHSELCGVSRGGVCALSKATQVQVRNA